MWLAGEQREGKQRRETSARRIAGRDIHSNENTIKVGLFYLELTFIAIKTDMSL